LFRYDSVFNVNETLCIRQQHNVSFQFLGQPIPITLEEKAHDQEMRHPAAAEQYER